ncbi:TlpA family protein disulfide reductase [Nitratifractor sp.]
MKIVLKWLLLALLPLGFVQAAQQPDRFTLQTIDGKTLHVEGLKNGLLFKELKGKVVFLEFWGTHCPPCLMSIPHYIDLNKKYKDKMAMVAIEVQATPPEALKAFVKAKGINYNVIPGNNASDFTDYIMLRTGWEGSIPYLIILDPQGGFVTGQVGLLSKKALAGVIQQLHKIAKPKTAKAPTTPGKEENTTRQ